mgnify:CR=1 FL=1
MNQARVDGGRALNQIVLDNLDARSAARGQWVLPCVPAACSHYLRRLVNWFADWGKPLRPDEIEQVRQTLQERLEEGFGQNAGAKLLIDFDLTVAATLQKNLALQITYSLPNLAAEYSQWAGHESRPLFGGHPDARVMRAVRDLSQTPPVKVLDVGAGDGRNAIPLARQGCQVDALELTPSLADRLQRTAEQQQVNLRVLVGDFFDNSVLLDRHQYRLVILSGVASHFRHAAQLRQWLERLVELLAPHGESVFNIFLADPDYQPDALVRQLSQVAWASLFTRDELRQALTGLPLEIVGDDPVFEYEQTNLPAEAWPPTPWFETWTLGRSIAPITDGRPPFQMYWIAVRRRGQF